MKKRILLSVVLVTLVLLFVSCATGSNDEASALPNNGERQPLLQHESGASTSAEQANALAEPTNDPTNDPETARASAESPGLSRGAWDGNVFTSDYLGLWIYISDDWVIATNEEIAEVLGLGAELMLGDDSGDFFDEIWASMDMTTMYDILISNMFTGASVQILYERLIFPNTRLNEIQYIAQIRPMLEMMGAEFVEIPGTTRIGAYDWYSHGTIANMFGTNIYGRVFVNINDGVVRSIILSYTRYSESPDDMLAMFGVLGTTPSPAPPFVPPVPEFSFPAQDSQKQLLSDHPLVGAWYWDMDDEYMYIFLEDGLGVRGFEDVYEFFDWSIGADDSNLLIYLDRFQESWTFTITGKVLTLTSRQVDGMTFDYIMIPMP